MKAKASILIMRGAADRVQILPERLLQNEFAVTEATDESAVLASLENHHADLVIIGPCHDISSCELALAGQIRRQHRQLPIILITEQSSEANAIAALRAGVNDYFKPPFSGAELIASIRNLVSPASTQPSAHRRAKPNDALADNPPLLGQSRLMTDSRAYLLKVAASDSNVLITGETGTGKELAAQFIHQGSSRCGKPLISINCAALPDSLLESELFGHEKGAFTGAHTAYGGKLKLADDGTVFFDEIGDMSPQAQAKILRAIESKEIHRIGGKHSIRVNFRVIAATNQDLESLLPERKFRQDLFFRLNVARIHLPPLRDHKEDIPCLLTHFLHNASSPVNGKVKGFSDEAIAYLLHYAWPGNVRELKNFVEALLIDFTSSWVSLADIPERLRKDSEGLPLSERDRLLSALFSVNWNKSKAAQKLSWSRMTLYRKMAKHGIHDQEGTGG